MDPVTLALTVAPLVAKAAEHFGSGLWNKAMSDLGDAEWGVLGRMAVSVRKWFDDHKDADGTKAVDDVVAKPSSQESVDNLADVLKKTLANDPDMTRQLKELVDEAKGQSGVVGQMTLQIYGNAQVGKSVQIGTVIGNVSI